MNSLKFAVVVSFLHLAYVASTDYRNSLPNGQNIPDPCQQGVLMNVVDYTLPPAQWTQFMYDFRDANYTWTPAFCNDDSDGDWVTNGAELGDPTCAFVSGASFVSTLPPTNPAVCQPFFERFCLEENYLSHFDVNQYCGGPGLPGIFGSDGTETYNAVVYWTLPTVKYTTNPTTMSLQINCTWDATTVSVTVPYTNYYYMLSIGLPNKAFSCQMRTSMATSVGTKYSATMSYSGSMLTDPCSYTQACLNGGNCTSTTAFKYSCSCPRGYEGPVCSSINYAANPCLQCRNAASCTELGGLNVNCACREFYYGSFCEKGPQICTRAFVEGRCQAPFSSLTLQPDFLKPNRRLQTQTCGFANANLTCFQQNTQGCPASNMTAFFPNMSLLATTIQSCCDAAGPQEDCSLYQTSANCAGRRSSAAASGLCTSFDTGLLRKLSIDSVVMQYCILAARFHDCLRNATSMCMYTTIESKLSEIESLQSVCCATTGPTDSCPGRLPCLRQNVTTCTSLNPSNLPSTSEATILQVCVNASAYLVCAKSLTLNCPSGASDIWGTTETWYRSCCLSPGPTVACPVSVSSCNTVNPCMNGGNCTNSGASYICKCKAGFTGLRCETNINECASSPCTSNATCDDQINFYRCICPVGYRGNSCNTQYFNTCTSLTYLADDNVCDYYLNCLVIGAKPSRVRCPILETAIPLLFDTTGRTCRLPSTFTAPGTGTLSTNCLKPSY